jgi:hypothetical protein
LKLSFGLTWLRKQHFVTLGALLLSFLYVTDYLRCPALPGKNPSNPLGWWGWWDQSKYLQSTRALARFDFSPAQHVYPLGYASLGAPFASGMPQHPFFFVDLASLLIAYIAFIHFARRCGVGLRWSAALFVLAAAADPVLFRQWVIPWNTSPLAAVMWLLLATAAAHIQGQRRPACLGVLIAVVPMLRPTDVLIAGVPVLASLLADIGKHRLRAHDVLVFLLAALVPLAAFAGLYLAIYGPRPSEYMVGQSELGFSFHDFGLKAYLILVDPRAWIGGGQGLIPRCPWLVLGIAGLLTAFRRPVSAMLAAALILHSLIYLSYKDLLPTNFWHYGLIHYWTFAIPGFALLGFLLLCDLFEPAHRAVAASAVVAILLLLCIRLDPVPATPSQRADALDVEVGPQDFETIYFGDLHVTDADGTLDNMTQMRAFPLGNGIRILALTRSLADHVTVEGQGIHTTASTRLRAVVHWGFPLQHWSSAHVLYGPHA